MLRAVRRMMGQRQTEDTAAPLPGLWWRRGAVDQVGSQPLTWVLPRYLEREFQLRQIRHCLFLS